MKTIKKVSALEVKRCFVVSDLCAGRTHKGHMKRLESEKHYFARLKKVKAKVLKMKEKELDKVVGVWKKRLDSYNNATWYLAEVDTAEVGVWRRAGELPLEWTNGSLKETGAKVRRALSRANGFKKKHVRGAHAIPGILATSINIIQKEKYLLPIIFKGGTGTQGRKRLKSKLKGDIDDGCMRSIALAVEGQRTLRAYFGIPKNKDLILNK